MNLRTNLFNSLTPENQRKVKDMRSALLSKPVCPVTDYVRDMEAEQKLADFTLHQPKRKPYGWAVFMLFFVSGAVLGVFFLADAIWTGLVVPGIAEKVGG